MMKALHFAVAAAAMLACTAPGAQAGDINSIISTYNEAATNGGTDAKLKAAAALGEAAMASPDRDDAALLALEAAKTLCLYGDCEAAIPLAVWVAGETGEAGSVSQAEVALVEAFARWRVRQTLSTRNRLNEALEPFVDGDLSTLTLAAFQRRYAHDAAKGKWGDAYRSASEASRHFEPFRGVIGEQWSDAKIIEIIAGFNMTPEPEEVIAMAEHHVALSEMIPQYPDPKPDWIYDHFYLTLAWDNALMAYFQSGYGERQWSNLSDTDVAALNAKQRAIMREARWPRTRTSSRTETSGSDLPFCDGDLRRKPMIRYSMADAQRGRFGSVVLRLAVEAGKVSDVELLAAVPSDRFEQDVIDAVSQWTWIPDEDEVPGKTCRMSRRNMIQEVIFSIG